MFAAVLIASALAQTPQPLPEPPELRRVRAPVIAASFGGAVLGTATGVAIGAFGSSGELAAVGTPALTLIGAAVPAARMTDARAGYVTLGAGIGMAGGLLAGLGIGAGVGAVAEPWNDFAPLIGAGIGGLVLGSLGSATGALVAAHLDVKGQERNLWAVGPTFNVWEQSAGVVVSGRF